MPRKQSVAAALTMEPRPNVASWTNILTSIGIFSAHQLTGTFGVGIFAYLLGISVHDLAALLGKEYSMRPVHYILTETPYFPSQIALGLWFGWLLGRRFRHHSMIYVWVLPLLVLCFAILSVPTLTPGYTSVLTREQSPFSHYFGWGCQPKDHCIDQLVTTMPFYAAASYSLGALLAFKTKQIRAPHD
jgi:hypothetical protein